jgi:hypothetical protein
MVRPLRSMAGHVHAVGSPPRHTRRCTIAARPVGVVPPWLNSARARALPDLSSASSESSRVLAYPEPHASSANLAQCQPASASRPVRAGQCEAALCDVGSFAPRYDVRRSGRRDIRPTPAQWKTRRMPGRCTVRRMPGRCSVRRMPARCSVRLCPARYDGAHPSHHPPFHVEHEPPLAQGAHRDWATLSRRPLSIHRH